MNIEIQKAVNDKALITTRISVLESKIGILKEQKGIQVTRIMNVIHKELGEETPIMFGMFDCVLVNGVMYEPPR